MTEKEDFDEEEFDDEELEQEEQLEVPVPSETKTTERRGKKPYVPLQEKKKDVKAEVDEDAYVAFHIPERNGILNKKENKLVGEDVLSILAVMMNKIEKIERAIG